MDTDKLEAVFGLFSTEPQAFQFIPGHRMLLEAIGERMKQTPPSSMKRLHGGGASSGNDVKRRRVGEGRLTDSSDDSKVTAWGYGRVGGGPLCRHVGRHRGFRRGSPSWLATVAAAMVLHRNGAGGTRPGTRMGEALEAES